MPIPLFFPIFRCYFLLSPFFRDTAAEADFCRPWASQLSRRESPISAAELLGAWKSRNLKVGFLLSLEWR